MREFVRWFTVGLGAALAVILVVTATNSALGVEVPIGCSKIDFADGVSSFTAPVDGTYTFKAGNPPRNGFLITVDLQAGETWTTPNKDISNVVICPTTETTTTTSPDVSTTTSTVPPSTTTTTPNVTTTTVTVTTTTPEQPSTTTTSTVVTPPTTQPPTTSTVPDATTTSLPGKDSTTSSTTSLEEPPVGGVATGGGACAIDDSRLPNLVSGWFFGMATMLFALMARMLWKSRRK